MSTFEQLGVKPELVRALHDLHIVEPTLIQEKAIPSALLGTDIIGISKTGSGKTAAFGVPLLCNITPGKGLQVLIVAPTRELAVQISNELQKFGRYLRVSIATIYGGMSFNPQVDAIRKADIIVGTPGRLRDHLDQRTMDLTHITCAVLDEADKMVEMGFIEDIDALLAPMPEHRQILLFGATISSEIDRLKKRYMHNPQTVEAEVQVSDDLLEQYFYNVQEYEKFSLLVHLLKKEQKGLVIIFCSRRSTVETVTRNLRTQGIRAEMIHGNLSQNKRLQVIEDFHKGKHNIMVASSVAARGLDIKDVTHIFNFDLSRDPQEYIHRIGRTARAGESGKAITLLGSRDHDVFREIISRYPVHVKELPLEEFPRLRFEVRRQEDRYGGRSSYGRPQQGRYRSSSRSDGERREHRSGPSHIPRWQRA